jgi:hypothetical protein
MRARLAILKPVPGGNMLLSGGVRQWRPGNSSRREEGAAVAGYGRSDSRWKSRYWQQHRPEAEKTEAFDAPSAGLKIGWQLPRGASGWVVNYTRGGLRACRRPGSAKRPEA